ncbi:MAG: T9SS type A sorting domain-containing protein [Vicingus serpentipes]|nr:T9SS type A sorting domain-containing protein [Vicingus serpentipes]
MKKIYLTLFLITSFFTSQLYSQCMEVPVSQQEMINTSHAIIEGEVISKTSFWDSSHGNIYTENTVKVYKVFKGNINSSTINILTLGGQVDDVLQKVEPSLQLRSEALGVFYLQQEPASSNIISTPYTPTNGSQSFIKYNLEEETASTAFVSYQSIEDVYNTIQNITNTPFQTIQKLKKDNSTPTETKAAPSISNFTPTTITAGTKSVLTINGSGFGATRGSGDYVSFYDADDGGSTWLNVTDAWHYVSWSDSQIKIYVPNGAGTGKVRVRNTTNVTSAATLTIRYNKMTADQESNSWETDLINNNGSGGYQLLLHPEIENVSSKKNSFMRALEKWRCATYVNFSLGTTSVDVVSRDGVDVVRFDNGSELPSSTLARTNSWWSGCKSGGVWNWYLDEVDMSFNDNINWEYGPANPSGSEYDFESVALHELGHAHQLGHTIGNSLVMHWSTSTGQTRRNLNTEAIDGGNYVMNLSTANGICGPTEMVPLNSSNCTFATAVPVANFVADKTTAYTGEWITFTDLSTNSPTSWAWTTGGAVPSAPATQNPQVRYFTTGLKTVTLCASNSLGQDCMTKTNYINIINNTTDVAIITNDLHINLFPNPMRDQLTLSFNNKSSKNVVVNVLNVIGETIYQENLNNIMNGDYKIDLSTQPNGVYFVMLTIDQELYTKKIVLSK